MSIYRMYIALKKTISHYAGRKKSLPKLTVKKICQNILCENNISNQLAKDFLSCWRLVSSGVDTWQTIYLSRCSLLVKKPLLWMICRSP